MKHLLKAHCHCLACPANSDRQHLIPKRCGTHTCPPAPPAGVGIPLTMPQLEAEGLPVVVSRLVGRRHYLLAVRICQALGLSTEQVGRVGLVAWSGRWYIGWEGWGCVSTPAVARCAAFTCLTCVRGTRSCTVARMHPCPYLLASAQVLVRWACDKISAAASSLPDDQLMEALQVNAACGACCA
jgi:hypothetical protein